MFRAGLPCDFSPGFSQNAIRLSVTSVFPFALSSSNLLVEVSPRPSAMLPASVGLNTSGMNFSPLSKFDAD